MVWLSNLFYTLLESESRYRLLTQYSLTGIYIHIGGTFKFVNNFFAKMLGYTPEEMIEKTYWNFVHPDDHDMVRNISLARARGIQMIVRYRRLVVLNIDGGIPPVSDFFIVGQSSV